MYLFSVLKKRKKVLLVSLSKNGNKGHSFQVNMCSLFLQHSPMAVLISKAKHAIQSGNTFLYSGK